MWLVGENQRMWQQMFEIVPEWTRPRLPLCTLFLLCPGTRNCFWTWFTPKPCRSMNGSYAKSLLTPEALAPVDTAFEIDAKNNTHKLQTNGKRSATAPSLCLPEGGVAISSGAAKAYAIIVVAQTQNRLTCPAALYKYMHPCFIWGARCSVLDSLH